MGKYMVCNLNSIDSKPSIPVWATICHWCATPTFFQKKIKGFSGFCFKLGFLSKFVWHWRATFNPKKKSPFLEKNSKFPREVINLNPRPSDTEPCALVTPYFFQFISFLWRRCAPAVPDANHLIDREVTWDFFLGEFLLVEFCFECIRDWNGTFLFLVCVCVCI